MTYYGRWTYKFEEGARRGAAGILIVHETGPAGYPFAVVQGNLGERFDLITPDKNMWRASIEGWLSLDADEEAARRWPGQDFDALKKQALTREFRPVPLGLQASVAIRNTLRTIQSKKRPRQAGRQRPAAPRRIRRLHGALGSSRQGRTGRRRRDLQRRARQRVRRRRRCSRSPAPSRASSRVRSGRCSF